MKSSASAALLGLAASTAFAAAPSAVHADTPSRPNIILFMVDDMGWMDSTVYGSEYYRTPALERLRERGMMFTNAYSANPLCTPTRASIMTGQYPGRLNMTAASGHVGANPDAPLYPASGQASQPVILPIARNQLALEYYTVAEAVRDAGYDTAFFGKWHLGSPSEYWPEHHGFNLNVGGAGNPGPPSFFSPYGLNNLPNGPVGEHITDRMTNEVLAYLDGRQGEEEPWMVFLWHWAVHAPFQGVESLIEEYRQITDPRGKQDCPTMGAMLESMDISLGQIIDYLDENDLWDDTLFVFFSDNGGNMYDRVTDPVTGITTTPTNNYPLSDGKGHIKEGGVRVPMVAAWPGVIAPNTTSDAVVASLDLYPTFVEAAGATVPPDHIVDGVSLVEHFATQAPLPRDAFFIHFPHRVLATNNFPVTSVRQGDWKLYRYYGEWPGLDGPFELYNLADDIGEADNLADAMPEKVAELDALIEAHMQETGSLPPLPNPNFSPPLGGWYLQNNVSGSIDDNMLRLRLLRNDPFITSADEFSVPGPLRMDIRMRIQGEFGLQVFWAGQGEGFAGARSTTVPLVHDGAWRVNEVALPAAGAVTTLRIDPGNEAGAADIDWIRVFDASGAQLHLEWDFGGPAGDSPFEPYVPNLGWMPTNNVQIEELAGFLRTTATGTDPFLIGPSFGPHAGPVRAELRLRSAPANAPLISQLMWANSQGGFGVAAGRGINFPIGHTGEWEVHILDLATPDINRLRFDPLQDSGGALVAAGMVLDVDYIRLVAAGQARGGEVLEEWNFGGFSPGSSIADWQLLGHATPR